MENGPRPSDLREMEAQEEEDRSHSVVYSLRFLLTMSGRTRRVGECSLSIIQPQENRCVKFKKQTRYVCLRKKISYEITTFRQQSNKLMLSRHHH